MRNKYKIREKLLYLILTISVLYIVTSFGISFTEFQFREWVKAIGIICIGYLVPLLGGSFLFQNANEKEKKGKQRGFIFYVIILLCFCMWGGCVFLYLIFNVNEEKRLTKSLLIANEASFLQENVYIYYEPVGFFLKKNSERTQEKDQEYLVEKYGKEVVKQYEALDITVYLEGMTLQDNFADEVFRMYVLQALKNLQIERNYYIKDWDFLGTKDLFLELEGYEDIENLANDISDIYIYIDGKTDFFKNNKSVLYFYSGDEEERITGYLPYGNLGPYEKLSNNYYKDSVNIEVLLQEKYMVEIARLQERVAYEGEINQIVANLQEQTKEADKSTEELLKEEIEETKQTSDIWEVEEEKEEVILSEGFFQEKAARRLFEEYLEKEGFAFEIRYNAKGFFYIDLEYRPAGEPQDKSQTGFYGYKLLYDRPSKNGKCEIFVLQRSHYTEEGIEESAVIVDMYAVETTTGQVVAGNKQNWGDPGTEEYRQITGE